MVSKEKLETLRASIDLDQPPYCSGALTPPYPHNFHLYYGRDKPAFIDLANASIESLIALTEACDPATFGLGGEDVLDESYRKAVKLDPSKFAITFDPIRCGLVGTIKDQLLQYNRAKTPLDCELSKLNVYGKDAFFRAHKDTPRSENMVGSLVVVFPTPHSGGELVLRHGEKEWTFDGASHISSQASPSIAYIAFYSDVEHEVLKVTSGHRVTITYNLYLLPSKTVDTQEPPVPIIRDVSEATNFRGTLEAMLKDRDFLPKGGTLGFGLRYQYPVTYRTNMDNLKDRLKGSDAHIWNACSDLGLEPKLWITYGTDAIDVRRGTLRVLTNRYYEPKAGGRYDEGFLSTLITSGFGYKVNIANNVKARTGQIDGCFTLKSDKSMQVVWVTALAPVSTLERPVMAYGNEAQMEFVYCDPCLLATVAPMNKRERGIDVVEGRSG